MRVKDNAIIDFYLDNNKEAVFLKCFLADNEQILFPCKESWITLGEENLCINNKEKEFIINRTITISKERIIYWSLEDGENLYWYSPKDTNELANLIKKNYYDYVCIILEKGKDIKDYKYLLSIEENYPIKEYDDCRALLIKERIKDSFKNQIVPKIKKKFKGSL